MKTVYEMKTNPQRGRRLPARRLSVRRRARGSTLVEFALIMPILLTMLIGIMEFGILTNYKLRISNAAREGARYAALGKTTDLVKARIQSYSAPLSIGASDVVLMSASNNVNPPVFGTPVTDFGGKNTVKPGDLIQVAVDTPHRSLTNFFPFLAGYRLRATVVMRRE